MASYPYISGQGGLLQAFTQLRKGFPPKVDAGYLQRFQIAPANESYVISILKFLGIIDENGDQVADKAAYFFGGDDSFRSGLEATIREAYKHLFDEMGAGALEADRDDLTHWFRAADKTSAVVGQRQASTFQTLAALAGHGELPNSRSSSGKKAAATGGTKTPQQAKKAAKKASDSVGANPPKGSVVDNSASGGSKVEQDVGLTVRIEVNLPPGGDAETYEAIFASIKKHLMS